MISKDDLNNLINNLKNDNMDVFDEFYDKTKNAIYYTILSIIKDKSLAEDIMQDTYLKILRSLSSYKPGTNALAWMIMIARNLSINLYNKRKREVYIDAYDQKDGYDSLESEKVEETPLINKMYEILEPKERELVVLHVINELTHKEIAEILNRPLGTVLWQYNQAIKKFRKKVGEYDEKN